MAVSKIPTQNHEWKHLGETVGTQNMNFPDNWSEILVQVNNGANFMTSIFNKNMLTNSDVQVSGGSYGTSYSLLNLSKTKGNLHTLNWGGTDRTSAARAYWYYR